VGQGKCVAYEQSYWEIQGFQREGRANSLRRKKPQGCMFGALMFRLWRHGEKGAHGIKNPLPVTQHPEGVCQHSRRIETHPHGALRSREAYPSQRSSLQGLLPHRSSTRKPWGFTPTTNLYIWRAGALLSRGHLAPSGFPSAGARWGESVVVAGRDGAGWQSSGPPGDPQRSSARRSRRRTRARP
jgi:hypothetical protein